MRRRKKNVRLRGSKTHGGGAMKKRRGAGNRGGRGAAGSGKRGDSKKPSVWKIVKGGKNPQNKGFTPRDGSYRAINIGHLSSIAPALVNVGKAKEQGGKTTINLRELGYAKLLGAGKAAANLHVEVAIASPRAKERIESAGGTLVADVIVDKSAKKKDSQGE